ncbi:hypothetical protein HNV12_22030 [Methanococcoides sp. SA1]|nr:hypothetical protein [Methanococcoides sp. SA1]
MAKRDAFFHFLESEKDELETYLKNNGVFKEYPTEVNSKIIRAYINLGQIYLCQNDIEKAKWFLKYPTTINIPTSRLEGISNKDDINLVFSHGEYVLKKGIFFDLSNSDSSTADRMFFFASDNFIVPKDDIDFWIKHGLYDHIAYGHLWRSYSLIRLSRYEEALELLVQVVPYLDRYRKTGVEMWRVVEYAMTKALIPLCEYKLNPTEENLASAKKGLETFIKGPKKKWDKLEGYLYYFHLKEKFADVYEAESVPADAKPAGAKPLPETKVEFPIDDEEPGIINITTLEGGYEDDLGSNAEVEDYCAEVVKLDDFLNLALLMETYVMDSYLEPEPIVVECKRLLAMDDIDEGIRKMTEVVLEAAEDAKETGHDLYFYLSEVVE